LGAGEGVAGPGHPGPCAHPFVDLDSDGEVGQRSVGLTEGQRAANVSSNAAVS
jgi:hypothetical protein